ncbi:16279_t:CDS:2 [Gigaspora margarita]|uniref:16279_t:CDS:1 n=1 Tax=Gigaspora margarita TaxID=4874 RepID=A0ABN7UJ37_GIGMA|nr:16279_t:CDS:2 [Gigaspora margarita]
MDDTNDMTPIIQKKILFTRKRKPTLAIQEKTPTTSKINLKLSTSKMQANTNYK